MSEEKKPYPKVGNMAPAFSLLDQNGKKVALKDFRGQQKVLVYFYPRAMTPGCTSQACGLRDIKKELKKHNTVVLAISPDKPEKLKKFEDKENLNFTLLSDEDHAIADKYGCWGLKKFMGKESMGIIRTSFLVGEDGRLLQVLDKFKTKTHHETVLEALDAL